MMVANEVLLVGAAVALTAKVAWSLRGCWRAVLNDARMISLDPALANKLEILYAYPGFWALFWYRLSHALLQQDVPGVSLILPRLVMAVVRYCTAIEIHPAATISAEGVFIDHGTGLVVGAEAVVGAGVTLFHGVTLGSSGKKVLPGHKRHPTIGDRVVVGAGAKILGDIEIGDDVLVGANSVVTKAVPANHTAVGVPARILCHGAASTGTDIAGAAICELHKRLIRVERKNEEESFAGGQEIQQQQPSTSSPASSSDSDGTELPSPRIPKRQQQQQQQQQQLQQQKRLLPAALPASSAGSGVEQVLYSQQILSAAS